jgi:hypothetical protein
MSMSDVAESAGLVHTADFMLGVIETEELAQQGLQLIKQLKSRYGDKMINNKFTLVVKKGNQRWVEPDGETAPKIPAASDHEMEISHAQQTTQEHMNKVHRTKSKEPKNNSGAVPRKNFGTEKSCKRSLRKRK